MNRQECIDAGINYDEGVARFVGNAEMFERFLREFPADTTYAALESAMEQRDGKAAFQAGHTLKGLTGNLSMVDLYRQLVVFVDALRGEGNMSLAETLYPAVQKEYRRVMDFLTAQTN